MQHEGSLPCSQESVTGPYPEPDASRPHLPTYFCKIHSNIILPSTPRSSQGSKFPEVFPELLVMSRHVQDCHKYARQVLPLPRDRAKSPQHSSSRCLVSPSRLAVTNHALYPGTLTCFLASVVPMLSYIYRQLNRNFT
jgi:hypothetical protein